MPLVVALLVESGALCLVEFLQPLEAVRVTRDEGCPAKKSCVLGHAILFGVGLGVSDGLGMGAALVVD